MAYGTWDNKFCLLSINNYVAILLTVALSVTIFFLDALVNVLVTRKYSHMYDLFEIFLRQKESCRCQLFMVLLLQYVHVLVINEQLVFPCFLLVLQWFFSPLNTLLLQQWFLQLIQTCWFIHLDELAISQQIFQTYHCWEDEIMKGMFDFVHSLSKNELPPLSLFLNGVMRFLFVLSFFFRRIDDSTFLLNVYPFNTKLTWSSETAFWNPRILFDHPLSPLIKLDSLM